MPTKSLIDSLLPKSRQLILKELFLSNDRKIHLRELARRTGKHPKTVQVELDNLLQTGIITEERSGNQKLYGINEDCPVYPELKMLIIKTAGVADEIKKALEPLRKKIHKAYIYGSFASGSYDSDSDIDLMVIGKAKLKEIVSATSDTAMKLKRVINTVTFTIDEYNERLQNDGFVSRVHEEEKIMLIGDDNDS